MSSVVNTTITNTTNTTTNTNTPITTTDLHSVVRSQWSLQAARLGVKSLTSSRLFCPTVQRWLSMILLEQELRR